MTTNLAIPGWRWMAGVVCGYLLLLVVCPVGAIVRQAFSGGVGGFFHALASPIGAGALLLSCWTAAVAAVINAVMGTCTAYLIARKHLPGRRVVSALIDLPLAVPTTVGGLMLVLAYSPATRIGGWLAAHHVNLVYSRTGIVLAMAFVTFPFAVRTVEPLVDSLDVSLEEAALTLGASRLRVFWQVLWPTLWPGVVTGLSLCFSRGLAEFGAVVLASGNLPLRTEVAPVYLYGLLENNETSGAAAVSVTLLALSVLGLVVPLCRPRQWWKRLTEPRGRRVHNNEQVGEASV
ncbi:ABC transporter permease [Alicyclobacillus shizuokensis]|uniref:ABC transporter permease n=1 Tax=Alicyclobacillus shizuokensis TaxID=392014 RepID=UPI0008329418|nr:sulfate ABC transporter permease subunit [Alicyclobacillus shizuokensis]MCL6627387.1 sulfate ABC transporter permease subunit [Alicyclobacillus shizuokensis]